MEKGMEKEKNMIMIIVIVTSRIFKWKNNKTLKY